MEAVDLELDLGRPDEALARLERIGDESSLLAIGERADWQAPPHLGLIEGGTPIHACLEGVR